MSKIKVIKKGAVMVGAHMFRVTGENMKPKSKHREMVKTVENWITDWHRTESRSRLAAGELTRLKLKDSTGI